MTGKIHDRTTVTLGVFGALNRKYNVRQSEFTADKRFDRKITVTTRHDHFTAGRTDRSISANAEWKYGDHSYSPHIGACLTCELRSMLRSLGTASFYTVDDHFFPLPFCSSSENSEWLVSFPALGERKWEKGNPLHSEVVFRYSLITRRLAATWLSNRKRRMWRGNFDQVFKILANDASK